MQTMQSSQPMHVTLVCSHKGTMPSIGNEPGLRVGQYSADKSDAQGPSFHCEACRSYLTAQQLCQRST